MSITETKKLTARKRLINNKLAALNSLTASGDHKTMLHDELLVIDRRLAEIKAGEGKRKRGPAQGHIT